MPDNRSEKPTKKRLDKARKEGQFLSAREFVGSLQFLAVLLILGSWMPRWWAQMRTSTYALISRAFSAEITAGEWPVLIRTLLLETIAPLLLAGFCLAILTLAFQLGMTKMGFSLTKLTPNVNRLNPLTKLKQLPQQNLFSVAQAIVLLVVVGFIVESVSSENMMLFFRLPLQNVTVAAQQVTGLLSGMLWKAGGLFLVFGIVDLFRQQRNLSGKLRMTKEEVRREHRESEGDPQIRMRIRRLRRDLLRRNMLKDVSTATAVVVNPTHYAVAIRYDIETMASPVVVAMGKNYMALRIRKLAVEHGVPIVENPPLARAMYGVVKVGQTIPTEFYRAVAEILAYIYRIMGHHVPTRS